MLRQYLERALRRERFRSVSVIAGAVLLVLVSLPFWGGALARKAAVHVAADRLGLRLDIGTSRLWYNHVVLDHVEVREEATGDDSGPPLAVLERVSVPVGLAWGSGGVHIDGARFEVLHHGPGDNVSALLTRLRGKGKTGTAESESGARKSRVPTVTIRGGHLRARDQRFGALVVDGFQVDLVPDRELVAEANAAAGIVRLRGHDSDPKFGVGKTRLVVPLVGLRPLPEPIFEMSGGYLQPLPGLGLTGITGSVRPAHGVGEKRPLEISVQGSYGGSKETLWTATGQLAPLVKGTTPSAKMSVRAARFSFARIKDVLPPTVLKPEETSVDAALDLGFADGKLGFRGNFDISGLNLHHEAVSSDPVMGLALNLGVDGSLDLARRRLELTKLEGRSRALTGILSGVVELREGKFRRTDGTEMPFTPFIDLAFRVPKLSCPQLLESIPGPIIPHLQGFTLAGNFEANVYAKIDYQDLESLDLGGKVGIDGCRVVKAPPEVTALTGPEPITQLVEIPSADKNAPPGAVEMMAFTIGLDNPRFVPYEKISPYLISSIMSTEDNGFFKHRGWVSSEFKTALKRNLAGGGFRLGASSITMQTVKNVLLSREKTLSRKLQELFLVWYLEQLLPKERILELYFNAIEFGPRIYGIGPAAKHYFGKPASDLTPLEAAFFSSILPSPKRRYVQYCHGSALPPWEKYVHKILSIVHNRGRLTDEEYATANAQTLVFDTTERPGTEAECLAWVKKITSPLPEPPPAELEN